MIRSFVQSKFAIVVLTLLFDLTFSCDAINTHHRFYPKVAPLATVTILKPLQPSPKSFCDNDCMDSCMAKQERCIYTCCFTKVDIGPDRCAS